MKLSTISKIGVFCALVVLFILAIWIKVYLPFKWQCPSSDYDFAKMKVLAHGGDGSLLSNAEGVKLTTNGNVWETFSFDISHDSNFAGVDYSISTRSNSILAMQIDEKPLQLIRNAPQDDLSTFETFPLRDKLKSGHHNLTVLFESLDKQLLILTLKGMMLTLKPSIP